MIQGFPGLKSVHFAYSGVSNSNPKPLRFSPGYSFSTTDLNTAPEVLHFVKEGLFVLKEFWPEVDIVLVIS